MSYALVLGLDFGTSGARAAVTDEQDHVVYSCRVAHALGDGPTAWRHALWELLGLIPVDVRAHLSAVAVDGTSSTVLRCHPDGEPCGPVLLYHDARAVAEARQLTHHAPAGHVVLGATSSLSKALWLQGHHACPRPHHLLHQADWIASLLHGQLPVSDHHNALKLGYDVERFHYPPWLLQLPVASWLPRVVEPGTVVGPVLAAVAQRFGIPETCRVCAGTTDGVAAFLAAGAVNAGDAVTSLGSTLVLKVLSPACIQDDRFGIYSHRLGTQWLVGGASNSGGAVLRMFFPDAEIETLSARVDPRLECGLDYYPLPAVGERFPINDPTLRPRMTPRPVDDVQFIHGLLDGMARIEAQGYQVLSRMGAPWPARVLSTGGGSGNPAWTALRARRLGVPVMVAEHLEAAIGTARLVRMATQPHPGTAKHPDNG